MKLHNRRLRHLAAIGAFATVMAVALTGCGRSDSGTVPEDSATVDDAPATGVVEVWAEGPDGAELPQMFERFQAENPDVDMQLTEVPSDEFGSKLTAAITAGTVPDLVFMYIETAPGLLATDGFSAVPNGLVEASDFFPAIWNAGEVDDVAFGVPWYSYASVTITRSDLSESAGTEAPANWDELRTYSQALKDSGVEWPLSLIVTYDQYSANQLVIFSAQNGGSLISDDRSSWTINDPANVEALEYWASLIDDGYASADGPQYLDTVPWVSQGRTAAIIDGGPWFESWFDDANGDGWSNEHLAFTPTFVGPGGDAAAPTGGASWYVPADSKNKDAAWKFARYMSQPESQVAWYEIFRNMPALESAWDDASLQNDPLLDIVRQSLDVAVARPSVPTWTQVGDVIGQQMERVARGQATAQEALDDAQQQAESIGTGE